MSAIVVVAAGPGVERIGGEALRARRLRRRAHRHRRRRAPHARGRDPRARRRGGLEGRRPHRRGRARGGGHVAGRAARRHRRPALQPQRATGPRTRWSSRSTSCCRTSHSGSAGCSTAVQAARPFMSAGGRVTATGSMAADRPSAGAASLGVAEGRSAEPRAQPRHDPEARRHPRRVAHGARHPGQGGAVHARQRGEPPSTPRPPAPTTTSWTPEVPYTGTSIEGEG